MNAEKLGRQHTTSLGLFRHGQTDWNIDFRLQGTTDTLLNEHGIRQVAQAANVLADSGFTWDVLVTSPLTRARQTGEILAKRLGFSEVLESPLLLERSFGIGEGMTYDEWQQLFASLDVIPGAETADAVLERAKKVLAWAESEFAGRRVLAISHGALIRYVLNAVSEGTIPPPGERLQNASLNVLKHEAGKWQLNSWAPHTLIRQV